MNAQLLLLWAAGSWPEIEKLALESPQSSAVAKAAINAAADSDDPQALRAATDMAIEAGVSRNEIRKALLSGIYNSFGRLRALTGHPDEARNYFQASLEVGMEAPAAPSTIEVRRAEQMRQLGLPTVWSPIPPTAKMDVTYALNELLDLAPQNPDLLLALAEKALRQGEFTESIRCWQDLAAVLGVEMPQAFYQRLQKAYENQKSFPKASPDEERMSGDGDKHAFLQMVHRNLRPRSYLEIGVQSGKSLRIAACPAIGIDPMPFVAGPLADNLKLFNCSSDTFFQKHADTQLLESPDLVFIDGMHLFEYALRDFMNVERYAGPFTVVAIDDIFPNHPAQAQRTRRTRAWTGDVWKVLDILMRFRPELRFVLVDAIPTGVLMVYNLDPKSTVLRDQYDEIVASYMNRTDVPAEYLSRERAVSTQNECVPELLNNLREQRKKIPREE